MKNFLYPQVLVDIPIPVEIEEINEKLEYDEPIVNLENKIKEEYQQEPEDKENFSKILSNITDNEETFSTYHVYIVRENDTIDKILDKYKVTREELADYNDLDNINLGTKLIIPCAND